MDGLYKSAQLNFKDEPKLGTLSDLNVCLLYTSDAADE